MPLYRNDPNNSNKQIKNPDIIKNASEHFGNQCIVVAIDVKKIGPSWMVHSHGGTINTNIEAFSWLEKTQNLGAGEILLTSITGRNSPYPKAEKYFSGIPACLFISLTRFNERAADSSQLLL